MRVLIGCEFSGIVRDAFIAAGCDAWSCDIVPCERRGPHILNDVRNVLDDGWDLAIFHPPCTFLSRAGARWKGAEREWAAREALAFVRVLANAPIPFIAIENPIGRLNQMWRYPDEVVQPWWFGDAATKATCLWLKNLPPLMATVVNANPFVNWTEFGYRDARERSRTFPGFASAMVAQWGSYCSRQMQA